MTDILAKYQELNKQFVLEKIKQNMKNDGPQKTGLLEARLAEFEENSGNILKDFYIFKLRHGEKSYQYWIIMFYFFRGIDYYFESEILELFRNNSQKLKLFARNIKYSIDLFYQGEEALKIKQILDQDIDFKMIFKKDHLYDDININDEIFQKLLMNSDTRIDQSKYFTIIWPEPEFSKIILKQEIKEKLFSIISQYRGLRNMIKSGQFKKEVRGVMPVVLFRGFPGTGKTLAAHAMSKELNLPVIKLKNANTRFIGSPNFKEIVESLNNKECIILMDDFDLIMKHLNISPNDLFEGLESSKNMIILTSNTLSLDDQFLPLLRRITYKFTFKIPGRHFRKLLWNFHLPPGYSFGPEIDIDDVASFFILTGGNIKNIIMNYILMNKDEKTLHKDKLTGLINEEIDKNDYAVNYHLKIENGFGIDAAKAEIPGLKQLISIIQKAPSIAEIKKEPLFICLYHEYGAHAFCKQLSFYLKKPIVIESSLDDKKFMRKYEERENMKAYLYEVLEPDDYFVLFQIPLFTKDDIKDNPYFFIDLVYKREKINSMEQSIALFYTGSYNLFNMGKIMFDYNLEFRNRAKAVKKGDGAGLPSRVYAGIKYAKGFNIECFIKNYFSGSGLYINAFFNNLLVHYMINGKEPLDEADIIKIYNNLMPAEKIKVLFGKAPAA